MAEVFFSFSTSMFLNCLFDTPFRLILELELLAAVVEEGEESSASVLSGTDEIVCSFPQSELTVFEAGTVVEAGTAVEVGTGAVGADAGSSSCSNTLSCVALVNFCTYSKSGFASTRNRYCLIHITNTSAL